ncbi:NAC domain-containing protein [Rhodotorula diobovata]|uniref:Nascent polypeptide-associated complex subunit alpha n=1 Tax=Rhodotorula diobovata TaxID=5288 RepID=A0A5C5G8P1_9BASI|nr:NAC domain-containing protein [Rhodotorula diobovata]
MSDAQLENGNTVADPNSALGRGETKARRALAKLGLKKVEGINRVVIKKPKGVLVAVNAPEVFKSPISDCYIVFGEAKPEDPSANPFSQLNQLAQAEQAQQQAQQAQEGGDAAATEGSVAEGKEKATDADADDADAGVDEGDINVVMGQANCDRAKAVKALKAAQGDIVQAILDAK